MESNTETILSLCPAGGAEDASRRRRCRDLRLVLLHVEVELLRRRKLLAAPRAEQPGAERSWKIVFGVKFN